MDDDRLKKALQIAQKATEKDSEGKYEEALSLYQQCLENWQIAYKYQDNPILKNKIYDKMEPYINRAEAIKQFLISQKTESVTEESHPLQKKNSIGKDTESSNIPSNPLKSSHSSIKVTQDDELTDQLSSIIIYEKPDISWDDIAGLQKAKDSLKEAVILPSHFPHFFTGLRKPWKGILLYGPPGTGKTQLARACAGESDATFLSVSSADLVSKWQGESEKLVRKLFDLARKMSPSVIFVDEIDSLCSSRSDRESECSRRIKTEFLVQMEGVSSSNSTQSDDINKRILILGATNEPWILDAAIRRRFERRIYIPLPDFQARLRILEYSLKSTPHTLLTNDFHELANLTEGFSGADISIFVRDALFEPIRYCQVAKHFKQIDDNKSGNLVWCPCNQDDESVSKKKISLMELNTVKVIPQPLTKVDCLKVLSNIKPSVNITEISRYEEWTKNFGVE